MPTFVACLRRSVERMWPPRVPARFGPGTRLRRPKNQWDQGPLATPQAEMCPRTANSGLREFLRLGSTEPVPDHSWLSKTRSRLPLEVHGAVFAWVLRRLAEHGLVKGDRIGVDASTTEANAALRAIVRRETGEGYHEMLDR